MQKDWIVFRPDPNGGYHAEAVTLPACKAYGKTLDEAVLNLKKKIDEYFQNMKDSSQMGM